MNVTEILEYLQAVGLVRLNKPIGDWYSIYCPFHNNGNEYHSSAGVLLHDQYRNGQLYPEGFWHCFACGAAYTMHDAIKELLNSHNVDLEVRSHIESLIGSDSTEYSDKLISPNIISILESRFALNDIRSRLHKTTTIVSEEELVQYRYTVPYMYERKLTDDIINRYDIGVDLHYIPKYTNREIPCITFPVRNTNGDTIYILRRAISLKRFYIPEDIEKSVYGIYELPRNCKSVVVTESCFNALTSVRYGRPAVALLGTGTPYQINQLKRLGVREFILGLDPDNAGRRATVRLKNALKDCAVCWQFEGIPEGKDINDLSEYEFNSLRIV